MRVIWTNGAVMDYRPQDSAYNVLCIKCQSVRNNNYKVQESTTNILLVIGPEGKS